MLKAAIEKITQLAQNQIHEIEGKSWSEKGLTMVEAPRYSPGTVTVNGINSIVELIKTENEKLNAPLFVEVEEFNKVIVYSTYDDRMRRQSVYAAKSDVPMFGFGWKPHNEAMIAFRSQFKQTADIDYILDLLSKITDENTVSSEDNGLSQQVEIKKGIALKGKEFVKPIVKLTPYRTFLEIEQPESEFLLRLNEKGEIGVFEADGGMWKLEAKQRIASELKWQLRELIDENKVVVMF